MYFATRWLLPLPKDASNTDCVLQQLEMILPCDDARTRDLQYAPTLGPPGLLTGQ